MTNDKTPYQPTWESVGSHPLPTWFDEAKLGVFFHWGLYSVPAWAPVVPDIQTMLRHHSPAYLLKNNPYAEWYLNTMSIKGSPTADHHRLTYGSGFAYDDFRQEFNQRSTEADLDALAALCTSAGARYSVLTTKHHDGFCLWPAAEPHPVKGRYHSTRDLVGDFCQSMRNAGVKPGLYYSGGFDWPFNGAVMKSVASVLEAAPQSAEYVEYANGHVTELIDRYQPDILWNDISYPHDADLAAIFAHYYNTVPDGVVNDRWSQVPSRFGPRLTSAIVKTVGFAVEHLWRFIPDSKKVLVSPKGRHYDFTTPEYSSPEVALLDKWESTRGVGHSFGANHNEPDSDILSGDEAIAMFIDIVAKGGNLLLGVGPAPDGTVPEAQQRPLLALGDWLTRNGDAIYGTKPATTAAATLADGTPVRFTAKASTINAILLNAPTSGSVELPLPTGTTALAARRVDGDLPLDMRVGHDSIAVTLPESTEFPCSIAVDLDNTAEARRQD